jgi:hypothetical protein
MEVIFGYSEEGGMLLNSTYENFKWTTLHSQIQNVSQLFFIV